MTDDLLNEANARLTAGLPREAVQGLSAALSYPASGVDDQTLATAFGVLARAIRAAGADADEIAEVTRRATDPVALFEAGFALYELGLYGIAATALDRANRIAPGDARIVGELLMCLESQLLYGAGSDIAEASGLVGVDPVVTYLAGFHAIMSGNTTLAVERAAQLDPTDPRVEKMYPNLRRILDRADAIGRAGIALDDHALTAWQAVIDGTVLLHASPYGHPDPMRGRYAFLADSPALMREGLTRLQAVLGARGLKPTRVVAAPDRASRVLAQAAAWLFGAERVPWTLGAEHGALVVAWQLESVGDEQFLGALRTRSQGQVLFVHLSNWVDPYPYAPDVTTALVQSATNPFTGGAMRVDPETRAVGRAEPDPRPEAALAAEILRAAEPEPGSVTALADVLAVARAWSPPTAGLRPRQWPGGPVPSSRFL